MQSTVEMSSLTVEAAVHSGSRLPDNRTFDCLWGSAAAAKAKVLQVALSR